MLPSNDGVHTEQLDLYLAGMTTLTCWCLLQMVVMAMVTEFHMHPAGIIETGSFQPSFSSLIIPCLTPSLWAITGQFHFCTMLVVMPPAVPSNTTGISYSDVCARQASLLAAQEKDAQWLNNLRQGEDAMEWNGFNNQIARSQGTLKPVSTYMFGPLIDAPPSHPDTILTTLTYMQRSLLDMGMTYAHLSMDIS